VLSTPISTRRATILYLVLRTSPLLFSNVNSELHFKYHSCLKVCLFNCLGSQGPCDNGLGRQLAVKYNFCETLGVSFCSYMNVLRTLEVLLIHITLNHTWFVSPSSIRQLELELRVNSLQFALLIFLDRHQLLDCAAHCWLVPWCFAYCLSIRFDIVDACMQMLFLFFSCLPLHSCMFSLYWIKKLGLRSGFCSICVCLNS